MSEEIRRHFPALERRHNGHPQRQRLTFSPCSERALCGASACLCSETRRVRSLVASPVERVGFEA